MAAKHSHDDEYRLPRDVVPEHYRLSIYDLDFDNWTYAGTVSIRYNVRRPSNRVKVNYRGLHIINVTARVIVGRTRVIGVSGMRADPATETFTVIFDDLIDSKFALTLMFSGKIQDNMAGFYRSNYRVSGDDNSRVMLSTQFSSTDARRAFPCADEPDLKASFDIKLAIPQGWKALGNMPIKSMSTAGGVTVVSFHTTPRMSTYVVGWAAGEFESISMETARKYNGQPVKVTLYTTQGLSDKGQFQLEVATKMIDLFSVLLDYDYVLPKLDMLAVHEMAYGAMENWGLITFRISNSLLDSDSYTSIAAKQQIAYVTGHEVAHHWFGNLATMRWWGDLWLKEGFATWLSWYAVDHLFPNWQVWQSFSISVVEAALSMDALWATHPIEVPVRSALDVGQIFDAISYNKGAAVIRMLAAAMVGESGLLDGISRYLKKFEYANADASDLWDCMGPKVAEFMSPWTQQAGFPLVNVELVEPRRVRLSQKRFFANAWFQGKLHHQTRRQSLVSLSEDPHQYLWPVAVDNQNLKDLDRHGVLWDCEKTVCYDGDLGFIVNSTRNSAYRIQYSSELLQTIISSATKLSPLTRQILLSDYLACAASGNGSTEVWLDLANRFLDDRAIKVWTKILDGLDTVRRTWLYDEVGIAPYIWQTIDNILIKIDGWDEHREDDSTMASFRINLISLAANSDHPKHVDYFRDTFDAWGRYRSIADAQVLKSCLGYVLRTTSKGQLLDDAFVQVLREVQRPHSVSSRQSCIYALGQVTQVSYISRAVDLILSDNIMRQDVPILLQSLSQNAVGQQHLWSYITKNWAAFHRKFSTNMVNYGYIIDALFSGYSTQAAYDDMAKFFSEGSVAGVERRVEQALELIQQRALWKQRTARELKMWLKQHTN